MEYYKLLQLEREPFSNSPDPNYFFQSQQHQSCLQKLELAIRLKRGLNVVIGHVGTGKTTLCRELIRHLAQQETFETHLILDPSFNSGNEMLSSIYKMLYNRFPDGSPSAIDLGEAIKHALFDKGMYQKRTVVIIIDEGQKIPAPCVELLRELLNYETNEHKLLQIVIFAQKEFHAVLEAHANFADRINLIHQLSPMSFTDTRRMIRYRIKLACSSIKPPNLFSLPAQWAIYRGTRGYPRRIINLCHQALLTMIIQNRKRAGWKLVQSCRSRIRKPADRTLFRMGRPVVFIIIAVLVVFSAPFFWIKLKSVRESSPHFKVTQPTRTTSPDLPTDHTVASEADTPPPVDTQLDERAIPVDPDKADPQAQAVVPVSPAPSESTETPSIPAMEKESRNSENSDLPTEHLAPPHPPAQLGWVTVKTGDTISGIVIKIYGVYRQDYVQTVLDANPHIITPDNIQLGESIFIPAIEFKLRASSVNCHWMVFDRCDTLNQAVQLSDTLARKLKVDTRPMALWSPDEGLYFEVLLQGYFRNRKSALVYVDELPPEISQTVHIISGWDKGTHIYSDPYTGYIHKTYYDE